MIECAFVFTLVASYVDEEIGNGRSEMDSDKRVFGLSGLRVKQAVVYNIVLALIIHFM